MVRGTRGQKMAVRSTQGQNRAVRSTQGGGGCHLQLTVYRFMSAARYVALIVLQAISTKVHVHRKYVYIRFVVQSFGRQLTVKTRKNRPCEHNNS